MKIATTLVIIVTVVVLGVFVSGKNRHVCDRTFPYTIGFFDHRFGITENDFHESIASAETIWESATGLNLFEYDPVAEFTINLVFDDRQRATIEKQRLNRKFEQVESYQSNISESYEHWHETYKQKKLSYENLLSSYNDGIRSYNTEVDRWNRHGGPAQGVYRKLEEEKKRLRAMQARLAEERVYINDIVEILHSMKDKNNKLVDTYKSQVNTYNSRYGEHTRFSQGEYDGEGITIYQFNDIADLTLVLAHELGHALGLGHVEDRTAVMHHLMGEQNLDAPTLTPDDINALKAACGFD